MKHRFNVRLIVLAALCLMMTVFAASCTFEEIMDSMPWAKDKQVETVEPVDSNTGDTPVTTTKPDDKVPVPDVEHKDEMSDDDFIKGTWGETSEK